MDKVIGMDIKQMFIRWYRRGMILLAVGVTMLWAIAGVPNPGMALPGPSPLSGLMALKATASESTPYVVATENHKPTLIEFYADWCTTCQAMAPTLRSIHEHFGETVNIVMLNIDRPEWQSQVQRFGVSGVPHLVLLSAEQTVVDTFIGKVPKQVLGSRLVELLG